MCVCKVVHRMLCVCVKSGTQDAMCVCKVVHRMLCVCVKWCRGCYVCL
jgi:hypothetical protein